MISLLKLDGAFGLGALVRAVTGTLLDDLGGGLVVGRVDIEERACHHRDRGGYRAGPASSTVWDLPTRLIAVGGSL
jgi:hypothetical protein